MNRGVIVTGGGHGIGKQICLDFLEAGDKVCFIDIDEKALCRFCKKNVRIYFIFTAMLLTR